MVGRGSLILLKRTLSEYSRTGGLILEIIGEKGLGKSYCVLTTLQELHLEYKEIDLSINKEIPFGSLIYNLQITPDDISFKEVFCAKIQEVLKNDQLIWFTNFEVCDPDSRILINYLLHYYAVSQYPAIIIVESNCIKSYLPEIKGIQTISFNNLTKSDLTEYGCKIVKANKEVLQKIVGLSNGNIGRFHIICRILSHLYKIRSAAIFDFMTLQPEDIPNSLISTYIKHYELIEDHLKPVLKIISFIDDHFYEELFKEAYEDTYVDYLKELVNYKTIIFHTELNNKAFQVEFRNKYQFILSELRSQIVLLSRSEKYELLKPYLLHLKDLADNSIRFAKYSYFEQIIILQSILNNYQVTDNILKYGIELMKNYYTNFAYENVITLRNRLSLSLNDQQINSLYPCYLQMVLSSFILTCRYKEAMSMEHKVSSGIEYCLVAKGFYLAGEPLKALKILEKIELGDNGFEVFNLKASIYNWFSDIKKSEYYIRKAYKVATEEQKYHIIKKVELEVNLDPMLPEYRQSINNAITYFRSRSKRELAEILFNSGTSDLFKDSSTIRKEGIAKIKEAKKLLEEICDNEVWYCDNSIAISHALSFEFNEAIQLWENIIDQTKTICFCELTIYLNIACAAIKIEDQYRTSYYLKLVVERILEYANKTEKNRYSNLDNEFKKIATEHADINLCIRNYFLVKALYSQSFQDNEEQVRVYAKKALDSSAYPSSSDYLLYNLSSRWLRHIGKTYIKKFFADHQMYFCPVMFWE
jgi:hypothetical protein